MRYDELTKRVVKAGLGVITFAEDGDDDDDGNLAAPTPRSSPLAGDPDVADRQDASGGPSLPRAGPGGPEHGFGQGQAARSRRRRRARRGWASQH